MASDGRLARLRALVDRIERLPASPRREWMLQEVRARMVDVETGVEPRPMRTLVETSPAPAPEPPASGASNGRAVKRPRSKPDRMAASPGRPRPEDATLGVPISVPDPAPSRIAERDPNKGTLADGGLLWLEDHPRHAVDEPGDGSTDANPWRRGLRG